MAEHNQRAYARGDHFSGTARVSADGQTWADADVADVSDVSSGGLSLHTAQEYEPGAQLWFELELEGFLSTFEVKTRGEVCRKQRTGNSYQYGIAFLGLSPEKKVQIDENIRAGRTLGTVVE